MNATTTAPSSSTQQAVTPTLDPQVRAWLRLEGLAALIAGIVLYGQLGGDWLWFVPALLAVDISLAGYLKEPALGATIYNFAHNWAVGLLVLGIVIALKTDLLALVGAVLIAHVGMDRAVGYGLKLKTSAHATHLGWMGRRKPEATTVPAPSAMLAVR
jgi:hypothetical protein